MEHQPGRHRAPRTQTRPPSRTEQRNARRRRRRLVVVTLAAATLAGLGVSRVVTAPTIDERAIADTAAWSAWLASAGASGVITEVGWPDRPDWNAAAARWANTVETPITTVAYWAAGENWRDTIPFRAFDPAKGPATTPRGQWDTLNDNVDATVVLASGGGSFNTCTSEPVCPKFSTNTAGRFGIEWTHDSPESLRTYAAAGATTIRVPVRWERLQRPLGTALDDRGLAPLKDLIAAADDAGLDVVVDLHNYGGYYVGDPDDPTNPRGTRLVFGDGLSTLDLVDFWLRLDTALADFDNVVAYELMNEPRDLASPKVWEDVSAQTVRSLRAAGVDTELWVDGYTAQVSRFAEYHPAPWIEDPLNRTRYAAQLWFDRPGPGFYAESVKTRNADIACRRALGELCTYLGFAS